MNFISQTNYLPFCSTYVNSIEQQKVYEQKTIFQNSTVQKIKYIVFLK